jgi:hypothetical protein
MRLSIADHTGDLAATERTALQRRLRFLLTRFSDQVEEVRLVLARDSGSPLGEFVCRAAATMRNGGEKGAEERDGSLWMSATRGADRIGRAVARFVEAEGRDGRRAATPNRNH